jgi:asparaginyl-tRNA synthetase
MSLGPYQCEGGRLAFAETRRFAAVPEVRGISPPDLSNLVHDMVINQRLERARLELLNALIGTTVSCMREWGALYVDLPLLTRMISSPGALNGRIPSDVAPFEVSFFSHQMYLSQSSQLYLEFALCSQAVESVYSVSKSFRREPADFRHLPEFLHVEFEARSGFEESLDVQIAFLKCLIKSLSRDARSSVLEFLDEAELDFLGREAEGWKVRTITFHDAFRLLHDFTKSPIYCHEKASVNALGAWEEVLITELLGGGPVFVTHFPIEEIAFYHASDPLNRALAVNADLLFPGYGEIMGAGERVRTREETVAKAEFFQLSAEDYRPYIESRSMNGEVMHSGWGMGCERFLQAAFKIPFIWQTKTFPRAHNTVNP